MNPDKELSELFESVRGGREISKKIIEDDLEYSLDLSEDLRFVLITHNLGTGYSYNSLCIGKKLPDGSQVIYGDKNTSITFNQTCILTKLTLGAKSMRFSTNKDSLREIRSSEVFENLRETRPPTEGEKMRYSAVYKYHSQLQFPINSYIKDERVLKYFERNPFLSK